MRIAAQVLFQKLTHALHYRHIGSILTNESRYVTSSFQPQAAISEPMLNYMRGLPNEEKLGRRNLPKAPMRFGYRWGITESLFIFAAQFGQGLVVWGITTDPAIAPLPTEGHFQAAAWRTGGDISTSIQTCRCQLVEDRIRLFFAFSQSIALPCRNASPDTHPPSSRKVQRMRGFHSKSYARNPAAPSDDALQSMRSSERLPTV
jgi:hypothetical protein